MVDNGHIKDKIKNMIQNDKRDLERALQDSFQNLKRLEQSTDTNSGEINTRMLEKAESVLEAEKKIAEHVEKAKGKNPTEFYIATVRTMEVMSLSLYIQHRISGSVPPEEMQEYQRLAKDAEELKEVADPEAVKQLKDLELESEKRVKEIEQ